MEKPIDGSGFPDGYGGDDGDNPAPLVNVPEPVDGVETLPVNVHSVIVEPGQANIGAALTSLPVKAGRASPLTRPRTMASNSTKRGRVFQFCMRMCQRRFSFFFGSRLEVPREAKTGTKIISHPNKR